MTNTCTGSNESFAEQQLIEEFVEAIHRRIEERGGGGNESSMLWFKLSRRSFLDRHDVGYELVDYDLMEPLDFEDSPLR